MLCSRENISVRIERRGIFEVRVRGTRANKCGSDPNENRMFYAVSIGCPGNGLCPRGFVVDHQRIHDYFETRWGLNISPVAFPSCEAIALDGVQGLRELVPNAASISVQIAAFSPGDSNPAGVTATWSLNG
jgi:hypothetical protein